MTDLETAIMIKNMARETVRRITAKNSGVTVEYTDGTNKSKYFETFEEAEAWAKSQGLKKGDPWESGNKKEYRITK